MWWCVRVCTRVGMLGVWACGHVGVCGRVWACGCNTGQVKRPVQDVPAARGPTYYVDPATGSDANIGSLTSPFKTIQRAVYPYTPSPSSCSSCSFTCPLLPPASAPAPSCRFLCCLLTRAVGMRPTTARDLR